MITSSYSPSLVALSLCMAIFASYTALQLARRVTDRGTLEARYWLAAGAFSMGTGIWTMHFIGMLALDLGTPLAYEPLLTAMSLAISIVAAAFALYVQARYRENLPRLAVAGAVLGLGIAGMHYTGMAAMIMPMAVTYDPWIFALSIAVAVGAAFAALYIASRLPNSPTPGLWKHKVGAACIMGTAICGMHYIGMAAASYAPVDFNAPVLQATAEQVINEQLLATAVGVAATLILIATQVILYFDYRFNVQTRLGDQLQVLLTQRTSALERQTAYLRASTSQLLHEVEDNRRLSAIVEQSTAAICVLSASGCIEYVNPQFERELGYSLPELEHKSPGELGWNRSHDSIFDEIRTAATNGKTWSGHIRSAARDGTLIDHDVVAFPILSGEGSVTHYVEIRRDITERLQLEQQLRHAQKLESIGQLAAGIAHEINTPSQYVGDNTRFLKEAFSEIESLLAGLNRLAERQQPITSGELSALLENADTEYLLTEIPRAIDQSLEGVKRVTHIVHAMKEFSHPAMDKTLIDINQAIESTVTVATNEWKYVADVELDLDPELPRVLCMPSDLNQVVLNMIVNAAHAITAAKGDSGDRGKIHLQTRRIENEVEIRISDNGTGIPEEISERIFDPFFTTKPVGKGTGQGLSIARTVIVERHGGQILVESNPGEGTCFIIRLPLQDFPKGTEIAA